MSNVVNFPPKDSGLVTPPSDLVGADGQPTKNASARSLQNEIIQRRNFILLDCATCESVISSGNPIQAYLAMNALMPQILLKSMEFISSNIAMQVVQHEAGKGCTDCATKEEKPKENEQNNPQTV